MDIRSYVATHGTYPSVAEQIGINPLYLHQLGSGRRKPSAELAVRIEQATNGAVARWELRPDLWSPPEKGDAA